MDQKKVHHKYEIAFNFKKEIPIKYFLSPLGDTLSPLGIVPFYVRNPLKIHLEQKKVHQNIELTFNFKKEIPLIFFYPLWGIVLFYIRNPFKIHLEQKKFNKEFNLPSIFNRKSL